MIITSELIKSVSNLYTVDQLQEKITGLIQDLETNGSTITSASTGAGASYTRKIEASREDLLSLYSAAMNYKLGLPAQTGSINHVTFRSPYNH